MPSPFQGVRLKRLVRTMVACPSQWDCWDVAGHYYYVRFRGGQVCVSVDDPEFDQKEDWDVVVRHGHQFDGHMPDAVMLEILGFAVTPATEVVGYDDLVERWQAVGKAMSEGPVRFRAALDSLRELTD